MSKLYLPVVSGGFDPIHSGHIQLIREARKKYQSNVIVLLNSDEWLSRKKGKPFMSYNERAIILTSLKFVDACCSFDDSDGTCIDGLEFLKTEYPDFQIVFCNGGDRTKDNIPEMKVSGIEFDFGIGGDYKKNSSSWLIRDAKSVYKETRKWGDFYDLYQTEGCKVKELVIKPGQSISYQRHEHRSEVWFVRSGSGKIRYSEFIDQPENFKTKVITKEDVHLVPKGHWHRIWNDGLDDLIIIEIQYGSLISEKDIIRLTD
jgi:cytidyltransferase-like protein